MTNLQKFGDTAHGVYCYIWGASLVHVRGRGRQIRGKLMVTHGAGGRFGDVDETLIKGGVLYLEHLRRRTSSDRSKQ